MRRAFYFGAGLLLVVLGSWVVAQENLPLADSSAPPIDAATTRTYSYSIGLEIGMSFQEGGAKLDVDSLVAGLRDGLNAAEPKFDQQTREQAMAQLGQMRLQSHVAKNQAYLKKNSQLEDVQVLPSGLQYQVLKEGSGDSPAATDQVKVHYSGELIDGTVFDSSLERNEPLVMRVDRVIPGWSEALQHMKVGGKWRLVIPSNLAYGEEGAGGVIPPHATLIFDVELLGIE